MDVNKSHLVSGAIGFFMGVCFWAGTTSFVDKYVGMNLPVRTVTASMSSLMSENVADSVGERDEAATVAENIIDSETPVTESPSSESASYSQSHHKCKRSDATSDSRSHKMSCQEKRERFEKLEDNPNGRYIVTSSGGSFHTSLDCRYLKGRSHTIKHITQSKAQELGYKDCPGC